MSSHSTSASVIYKNERRRKTGHCRTYKTNLLNLVENKLDCKRNCYERSSSSYAMKGALRATQIRSKHEMEKMKRAQVQVHECSMQKLRENHETIQQLTFQLQQIQEQMNSMNSPGEFQDIQSNCSGRLSHVSSQPEMIPSSRVLLSRDKRLPLDAWNQSGVQENVFGHQFSAFDSPRDFPQRSSSENRRIMWSDSKDSKCRNYNSTKFPTPESFLVWKFDSKHKSPRVLIFHRLQCCGSKKWRWLN